MVINNYGGAVTKIKDENIKIKTTAEIQM